MIDLLKQKLDSFPGNQNDKYNYLREFFQLLILKKLDEAGYFQHIAFVGGTALRILYSLHRFSEDLDFSLISKKQFDFATLISKLKLELERESISVDIKTKISDAVCFALFKFKDVLFKTGLSSHKDQVIMIKLEVDMRPPAGFHTELSMISKEYLIAINHFDKPSLYAGKLHALLQRKYTKGRDYYDYLWYVGQAIQPNLPMLNHALEQTMGKNPHLNLDELQTQLKKRFNETDFNLVKKDIEPFLQDSHELRLFSKDIFLQTLK